MSKLEKKLFSWIWFLLAIYPFLMVLVNWGTGNDFTYFPSFINDCGDWLGQSLYVIFLNFGYFPDSAKMICDYAGYLMFLELLRLFLEVLLWLPRFARKLLEKPFGGN